MIDTVSTPLRVNVLTTEASTANVLVLKLGAEDGRALPSWGPGAHIDLELPSGLIRQYSLCGPLDDEKTYTVAVLRQPDGRGGSSEIHASVAAGDQLTIRGPRNHFPLEPSSRYLFIAGGIGITPMMPMIELAEKNSAKWSLLYGGRSLSTMAFLDQLMKFGPDRVTPAAKDLSGRPDLAALLEDVGTDTLIYCCGPSGLMESVEAHCVEYGLRQQLRTERFASAATTTSRDSENSAFDVQLERSGMSVRVGADQTILDALENAGVDPDFSCREGYCGACEVTVLSGTPEHRDTVSSPAKHDAAKCMMICVGRSKSPLLLLDL